MKKYNPKKMIADSRYRRYFDTLSAELQADVLQRMERLLVEEAEWCDKGNYGHMCNILANIALDEALQTTGMSPEAVQETLSRHMWAALKPEGMKKLAKLSFFMPLMKKVVPLGFSKMSGKGWHYVWHLDTDGPQEFHFECTECLYKHIFSKRGLLERFGPMYCHSDIINYGSLPHTDFIRTQTLCQGGEKCDFCFIRHAKDEKWQRTESV